MKKILIKIIPNWVIKTKRRYQSLKFKKKEVKDVFTEIYKSNYWSSNESVSGKGSEEIQTKTLVSALDKIILDYNIKSFLDIPCGDFKWMQKVNFRGVDYIGADIVEDLININNNKYQTNNINFKTLNLISDKLPCCDLVFVRDCFVHLSFENILSSIENIKASGSKYLLTTSFTDYNDNYDIITGDWRKINLQKQPFNFGEPMLVINENCTEDSGLNTDKSMVLWKISLI